MSELIDRQEVIKALCERRCGDKPKGCPSGFCTESLAVDCIPSAQPERMTNRQWIDFLSAQFDISRTSAKEMLHRMMQCKKEDNFKKLFNGGQDSSRFDSIRKELE